MVQQTVKRLPWLNPTWYALGKVTTNSPGFCTNLKNRNQNGLTKSLAQKIGNIKLSPTIPHKAVQINAS